MSAARRAATRYVRGIAAAEAKMAARVGAAEAAKWKANSIAAAQMYETHQWLRRKAPVSP